MEEEKVMEARGEKGAGETMGGSRRAEIKGKKCHNGEVGRYRKSKSRVWYG